MVEKLEKKRIRLSPEDRRAQLLDVAVQVYGDLGLGKANHSDIAKAAGVSTATVFNYFPTVEDLNLAVIKYGVKITFEIIEEFFEKGIALEQKPYIVAMAFKEAIIRNSALVKLRLSWGGNFNEPYRSQFLKYLSKVEAKFMLYFGDDDRSVLDAKIIMALSERLAGHIIDGMPDEEVVRLVVRGFEWYNNRPV